jgi:hypothetical protein
MEKEFVPYTESLALKELGFNEPCFGFHSKIHGLMMVKTSGSSSLYKDAGECLAPLYQQAFRWFREKYQLHSTITSISQESWQWHITKPSESLGKLYEEDFYTYEEAELECLKKLIEIVEQKEK